MTRVLYPLGLPSNLTTFFMEGGVTMLEEKQETRQEVKVTRRALLFYLVGAAGLAVAGTVLITKVTADDEAIARDPKGCAPEDKCLPWAITSTGGK
jgi:hypothetical protein